MTKIYDYNDYNVLEVFRPVRQLKILERIFLKASSKDWCRAEREKYPTGTFIIYHYYNPNHNVIFKVYFKLDYNNYRFYVIDIEEPGMVRRLPDYTYNKHLERFQEDIFNPAMKIFQIEYTKVKNYDKERNR